MLFLVSTWLRVNTTSRQQEKKHPSLKTLKPLSIYTQNPKVRNLLQKHPTKGERENKERGPKAEVEAKDPK
jgi:hypothetical protein